MMIMDAGVNVSVIVGAGDPIGAAVAAACGRRGDVVITVDGADDATFAADIASFDGLTAVAEAVAAEYAAVRTLVNCHFAIDWANFRDSTIDAWERVVHTNVLGPVAASKAFLPLLEAAEG